MMVETRGGSGLWRLRKKIILGAVSYMGYMGDGQFLDQRFLTCFLSSWGCSRQISPRPKSVETTTTPRLF